MSISTKSLKSVFPMDSDWELDDDGQVRLDADTGLPVADRAYNASDLRRVIASYVTDGVVTDWGDELVVTVEGGSVYVGTGTAFANGLLVDVTERAKVADLSDIQTGSYLFAVIQARFDQPSRDALVTARVEQSASAEMTRNESVWELALARVDWRGNVSDLRMNEAYCGPVSAVVPVDTDSFMAELKTAVSQFNLNVGDVTTLPSGTEPTVVVRKPEQAGGDVYIDFGIPRGAPGEPGRDGDSAPTMYVQDGEPPRVAGNVWMVDDDSTSPHAITAVRVYEMSELYPGSAAFPGEGTFPGGSGAWEDHVFSLSLFPGSGGSGGNPGANLVTLSDGAPTEPGASGDVHVNIETGEAYVYE